MLRSVYDIAYEAGVRFFSGSETGFGITPYGEWATRELLLMVNFIGIPPDEVLRMATIDQSPHAAGWRSNTMALPEANSPTFLSLTAIRSRT